MRIINSVKNGTLNKKINDKLIDLKFIKSPKAKILEKQYTMYKKLERKYREIIRNDYKDLKNIENKVIWVCWFQGIENAPKLIKACFNSLKINEPEWKIILLTEENIHEYLELPQYIISKYNLGIITKTHMSDIIRVEILCKYGGLWVDSTVLCTDVVPKYIYDSNLFVYKSFDLDRTKEMPIIASSWLIFAKSNNKILLMTRDLLREYWKKEKCLCDYFLFHLFFAISARRFDEEWKKVTSYNNISPHILMFELGEKYSPERWEQIINMTPFHKLERHTDYLENEFSMYEHIIKRYIR